MSYQMEFWEAFECTIMVQLYFHLKTCRLMTDQQSIPDQAVNSMNLCSNIMIYYLW